MKEFKKWWEKNKWKVERHNQRRGDFGAGWKGALKYILSQETIRPLLGGSKHKYVDSIVIRKELGE